MSLKGSPCLGGPHQGQLCAADRCLSGAHSNVTLACLRVAASRSQSIRLWRPNCQGSLDRYVDEHTPATLMACGLFLVVKIGNSSTKRPPTYELQLCCLDRSHEVLRKFQNQACSTQHMAATKPSLASDAVRESTAPDHSLPHAQQKQRAAGRFVASGSSSTLLLQPSLDLAASAGGLHCSDASSLSCEPLHAQSSTI